MKQMNHILSYTDDICNDTHHILIDEEREVFFTFNEDKGTNEKHYDYNFDVITYIIDVLADYHCDVTFIDESTYLTVKKIIWDYWYDTTGNMEDSNIVTLINNIKSLDKH